MAADKWTFKPEGLRRNRALAWDKTANAGRGGAVTTDDCMGEDGEGKAYVDVGACNKYGVKPEAVTYITIAELPEAYRKGAQSAIKALAEEWGAENYNDVVLFLVLASKMQDLANESIKRVRPVSDKTKGHAAEILRKVLEAQGRTPEDIERTLSVLR